MKTILSDFCLKTDRYISLTHNPYSVNGWFSVTLLSDSRVVKRFDDIDAAKEYYNSIVKEFED